MALLLSAPAFAQEGKQTLIKKTTNFDISGDGTAPEWNRADWISLEKRRGVADYTTRVKLLYSETGIFGLFSCQDVKITATLKEDFANLWTEDVIEVFFWPDESVPLYFEYELSPLNYELAILVPNMDGTFFGWKPWQYDGDRKTRHATRIVTKEDGTVTEWRAEFFIPYSLLKPLRNVPPEAGDQWRMNLYRIDYDNASAAWSWQPVRTNFHNFERFGVIVFE